MEPMNEELRGCEDEEEQNSKHRDCESFQHHQTVICDVAVQFANGAWNGGCPNACVVLLISGIDGGGVGCIVDAIDAEESHHKEDGKDEQQHSQIGHHHFLPFVEFDGDEREFRQWEDEEDRSKEQTDSHRYKEEDNDPCVVVLRADEATD